MVVLLALFVAKTYITIVYNLLCPQRSKQFHCLPSIVEGSIGYTCSLANQTDPPTLPDAEQYAADHFGLQDKVRSGKCESLLVLTWHQKYVYEDRARRTGNLGLCLDGLAQVVPLLLQVVVF